jgi:chemotaxis protein CheD
VTIVVNVSDAAVSDEVENVLTTYSLGSCIGVCTYDPTARVAGMLHFQLPSATIDPQRAQQNPFMFADTGMECLLNLMTQKGADRRRLRVKLAGGAQMLNDNNLFNIGRRNQTAIRKVLWQHGLLIDREDLGGNRPRTLFMKVADGTVTVKSGERTAVL